MAVAKKTQEAGEKLTVIKRYEDLQVRRVVEVGEVLTVDAERANELKAAGVAK